MCQMLPGELWWAGKVQGACQGESLAVPSILGEQQEGRGSAQPVTSLIA